MEERGIKLIFWGRKKIGIDRIGFGRKWKNYHVFTVTVEHEDIFWLWWWNKIFYIIIVSFPKEQIPNQELSRCGQMSLFKCKLPPYFLWQDEAIFSIYGLSSNFNGNLSNLLIQSSPSPLPKSTWKHPHLTSTSAPSIFSIACKQQDSFGALAGFKILRAKSA